jgi:hypothetical protein
MTQGKIERYHRSMENRILLENDDKKPFEDLSSVAGQTIEQARRAMENYLDFFQKSMSASP